MAPGEKSAALEPSFLHPRTSESPLMKEVCEKKRRAQERQSKKEEKEERYSRYSTYRRWDRSVVMGSAGALSLYVKVSCVSVRVCV